MVLAMIFVSACMAQEISSPKVLVSGPDGDEYKAYSDLINSRYIGDDVSLIVLEDQTNAESNDINIGMSGVDRETIEDYQAKNKRAFSLERLFNLKADYELISDGEYQDLFEPDPESGWDIFYSIYPESQGILTLSRIGFNENRTQALVHARNQAGPTTEEDYYYLLEKNGASWVVKDMFEA